MFDAAVAVHKAEMEREFNCPIWETKEGRLIPVTKMETSHLYNSWRYMVAAAKKHETDGKYVKAMTALAILEQEFKLRKLSYVSTEFQNLLEDNKREVSSCYDEMDRDLDGGSDPKSGWWYMGNDD